MMKARLIIFTLAFFALMAASQADEHKYYNDSVSGIRLPKEVGIMKFKDDRRYDDPRLGVAIRYTSSQPAYADIYLYPIPDWKPGSDDKARAKVLQENFKSTIDDVFTARKYGYYESVKLGSKGGFSVERGKKTLKGYKAVFTIKNRGRLMKSYLYIFAFNDTLFKVRYSHLQSATKFSETMIDNFVRQLLGAETGAK